MAFNTDIFDNKEISFHAKGIYCLLSKFTDKKGKCWPSLATLQALSGLSKPTIIKAIKDLSNSDCIEVEHRFVFGMKTSSMYKLKNLVKTDVNDINHDVKQINNVDLEESKKNSCQPALPSSKRGLLTDVNDIDINLSNINLSINNSEQMILEYLPTINGYPFDQIKDLAQIKEWLSKYPIDHVLNELEKFNSWWRDNELRFKGKKNFRASITNWLKKSKVEIKVSVRGPKRLDLR